MTATSVINQATILYVTFTLLSVLIATGRGEPTLQDVTERKCPSKQPFKCLPYGVCCGGDQYCYDGDCQGCFPPAVTDEHLLSWCQMTGIHNTSLMNDISCSLACQARFTVEQLANKPCSKQIIEVDGVGDTNSDNDQWYHRFMAMCIVSVLLCCSTITFLLLLCYTMFGRRWMTPMHSTHEGLSERLNRRRSRMRDDLNEDGTVRYTECAPSIAIFNETYEQLPTSSAFVSEERPDS